MSQKNNIRENYIFCEIILNQNLYNKFYLGNSQKISSKCTLIKYFCGFRHRHTDRDENLIKSSSWILTDTLMVNMCIIVHITNCINTICNSV